jgi:hypothetical protein
MQNPTTPTEDDDASIPTERVRIGPRLSAGNRKAAKRTFPWELTADEIQLALPRPQDEDDYIRETKRPRLEEPIPTSADEASTEKTSRDNTVELLPAAAAAADRDASDPVMDTQPNVMTTRTSRHWTPEEDAKLTSAVTDTCKKKWARSSSQIGSQFPRSFPVERKRSVITDGLIPWSPKATGRMVVGRDGKKTKTPS